MIEIESGGLIRLTYRSYPIPSQVELSCELHPKSKAPAPTSHDPIVRIIAIRIALSLLSSSRYNPASHLASADLFPQAVNMGDPRESSSYSVTPRIRYNTIGGVNGPLVILENVSLDMHQNSLKLKD